jgi:DNA polymerase I-like protein with 3'-5' exonuclease and polymerase domains|tara:strand:+ start:59 stop:2071 length:2013 start_codon:yes stop_codon:yes gene_type:complete
MCKTPEDLDLDGIDTVAVDLETYDPNLKTKGLGAIRGDGFVCGVAVATGRDTVYFPINHSDTNLSLDKKIKLWEALDEKLFQNEKITKVFHNAMYDVCWIRAVTGKKMKGRIVDTMIAGSVIDENRFKYSLDSLSKDYKIGSKYQYDLQQKTLEWSKGTIKDPMTNMHKLPASIVKDYAKQDVDLTFKLWKMFNEKFDEILYTKYKEDKNGKRIKDKNGKDIIIEEKTSRNIFELETKLFPCLVDMKFKGVKIDVEKAKAFGKRLEKTKNNIINYIARKTNIRVEIWAASSIKALLDHESIDDYTKTPKSGMPQLPKNYLSTHKNKYLRLIAKARELDKAKNTFVDGLLGFVHNGRIHADINQIRGEHGGTVTGRFSMSNPNLQQIPSKGYIGKKMRELFIPETGSDWYSFDYSQQEPRIVVHYAIKLGMDGTDDLKEEFDKEDADFHQIVADMANIPRKQAKTINLGLFYGMGRIKLQKELNLDSKQAQTLFNTYHSKVPFVKQLSKDLSDFASEEGLLFTVADRFCRFDKWETRDKEWNPETNRFTEVKLHAKKEDAIDAYKLEQMEKYDKYIDPTCEHFEKHYTRAFTYKALNRLIQGSAADMTKKAMVLLYEKGIVPHIQIHDELCVSIKDQETRTMVQNIMEQAIELEINNKVDCESGPNWGNIK